jgi:hypothetical protein
LGLVAERVSFPSSAHDCLPEFEKQLALQQLCKEIRRPVACQATLNQCFFLGDLILPETASNTHMFGHLPLL